jgi:hypothetical protein
MGRNRIDTKTVLHEIREMKNVTLSLDEEVARWARVRAAEEDTSVSRLVGEMLAEKMRQEDAYRRGMNSILNRPPIKLRKRGERMPSRDELYDRKVLR